MSKGYTDMFRWQRKKQEEIKTRLLSQRLSKELNVYFKENDGDWSGMVEVK